ncbi:uncharacterized protein LOC126554595 [Aphis gossypii]|uniref:uncharacterized protein LOC126554595 n=1 Tax=Aphis gossypii TaxID=80765 RepID=UPI002159AABE|nr:uncharacterized protein LOC126554595 [Aphis gossypii]
MLSSTINPDCSEYIIFDYDVDERENVFTELNNITTTNNQEPQDTQEVTEQISNRPEEFNNEIPSTFMSQIFNNEIPSRSILQVKKNYEVPSVNKVRKRMNEPLKLSTLNFLEQKHVKEHETHLKKLTLEEKKLELEEKRIKLDTEKFEFDKKEKTDNFNLEKLVREEQLFMEKREREERMILERRKGRKD